MCNFAILAEEAIGAGIRRITAVTGDEALAAYKASDEIKLRLTAAKGLPVDKLPNALKVLRQELDDAVIPAGYFYFYFISNSYLNDFIMILGSNQCFM